MPPVLVQNHKILSNFDKCFGDDEVIQHWQQKNSSDSVLVASCESMIPSCSLGALVLRKRSPLLHPWSPISVFKNKEGMHFSSQLLRCEMDTILPPLLLFVIPSNHQVPAPYLPFLLCSSYFPLSNPASTTTTTTTTTSKVKSLK